MNLIRKLIKPYARKPLLLCVFVAIIAYCGPSLLPIRARFDFTWPIDRAIPAVPLFTYIYIFSYPFWIANYILIANQDRDMCRKLVFTEIAGKVICFLTFILLPCTFARPAADTLSGPGAWLLKIVYLVDEPTRLLPSIHCFESWLCFRPLLSRGAKKIPVWYRIFSGVFAVLICLSTLYTRQHVLIDVFAGVLLAEVMWDLAGLYVKKRPLQK